jgi:hypothetical protein
MKMKTMRKTKTKTKKTKRKMKTMRKMKMKTKKSCNLTCLCLDYCPLFALCLHLVMIFHSLALAGCTKSTVVWVWCIQSAASLLCAVHVYKAVVPSFCTATPLHCHTATPAHHYTAAPLHCHTTVLPPPHHYTAALLHHHTTTPLHHCTTAPPHHHTHIGSEDIPT